MKVISIREPFASLIKENKKTIETRSWKTNYRGKIYIHSCSAISKSSNVENAMKLLEKEPTYSKIICSCNLVDCIYMDEHYIENIRKSDPLNFTCGRYEVGRYAWILTDIQPLDVPINAKGKLGIWNYNEGE